MKKLFFFGSLLILFLAGCTTTETGLFSNSILPDINLQVRSIEDIDTLELKVDTKDFQK